MAGRDLHVHHPDAARRVIRGGRGENVPCPYPGLAPFSARYADWFYGRERVVATVCERLDAHAPRGGPLFVIGPSGSGKSSLLAAGVLPALAQGALPAEGSAEWAQILFTPTAHPAAALAEAAGADRSIAEGWVRDADRCLRDLHVLSGTPGLVVVVDQFEEIFTLCIDDAERDWFVDTLDHLARSPTGDTLVILGLRADFYAQCLSYASLRAALSADPVLLEPMTESEIKEAVRLPAMDVGLEVEAGLVELLLAELGAAPWAAGLPLLAHALRVTWQQRSGHVLTVDGYRATGGISGAIAATAEQIFESLPDRGRELARFLFLRLVVVGRDAEDARRRLSHADLLRGLSDGELARAVAERFTDGRLLVADTDSVTIAHEAVMDAWPRLRAWIDEDRAANLVRQEVEEAARAWQAADMDATLLYRGNRLEAAQDWATAHVGGLSHSASTFLAASRRQRRRGRRLRRGAIAVVVGLALAASGLAAYALQQSAQARAAADAAIENQISAEALQLRDSDPTLSAQLTLAAYRRAPNQDTASRLIDLENTPLAATVTAAGVALDAVAFSPRGGVLATGGADGTVQLWNAAVAGLPRALGHPTTGSASRVESLAFSPDGELLAVANDDDTVNLWNVANPDRPTRLGTALSVPDGSVYSVAFSPSGDLLAVGGATYQAANGIVEFWNVADPGHPAALPSIQPSAAVTSLAFSPNGGFLVVGGSLTIEVWGPAGSDHLEVPSRRASVTSADGSITSILAISPDGTLLVTASENNAVQFWYLDGGSGRLSESVLGHILSTLNSSIDALTFSPDGRMLAISYGDGSIALWNMSNPIYPVSVGRPLAASTFPVASLAFSPDGHTLAAGNGDGSVSLWHIPATVLLGGGPVALSTDGRTLATFDSQHGLRLWDMRDASDPTPLGQVENGAPSDPTTVAFSPDGRTLAFGGAGGDGGTAWLVDVSDPKRPLPLGQPLSGFAAPVDSVAFSPDGRTLATASGDGTVDLWSVTDPRNPGLLSQPIRRSQYAETSVAFSPDGRTLATASSDGTVDLWNIADLVDPGPLSQSQDGSQHTVTSLAFTPDGLTLATADSGGAVRLWNVADPRNPETRSQPLSGSGNPVEAVAISPSGRTLAAGSGDGSVRVWDIGDPRSPTLLGQPLTGPGGGVDALAFDHDDHTLAVGGDSGTAWLWNLDVQASINRICTAGGGLTRAQWNQYVPQFAYQAPCSG